MVDKVKRNAAAYFAIQGVAVLVWWLLLYLRPGVRVYFQLERNSQDSLMAFWLADIAFLGLGSLVASWLIYRGNRLREAAAWFVTGCVSYASVYCLAFTWMTDFGWLGVPLMFPAMIWSGVFAVGMTFEMAMFRPAAKSGTGWVVFKTFTQIVIVWGIILVVIPILIQLRHSANSRGNEYVGAGYVAWRHRRNLVILDKIIRLTDSPTTASSSSTDPAILNCLTSLHRN